MNTTYREQLTNFKPQTDSFREFRLKAYGRFQQIGLPTRKDEAWKYMNLEPVLGAAFQPASLVISRRPTDGPAEKSQKSGISQPFQDFKMIEESNSFALINAFSFDEVTVIRVAKNESAKTPFHISLKAKAGNSPVVYYPRIHIELEEGAKAEVILEQADSGPSFYLMNAVVQIRLGRNSKLTFIHSDHANEKAVHLNAFRVELEEGSQFEAVSVTAGAASVRNDFEGKFLGENACFSLDGLAVLGEKSQVFQHVAVLHRTPNNVSRQYFKNILSGQSQAEYTSLVHVDRGAVKSDAGQLDRNLLLSDTARVWSRPQLKIDADDVKANHGAATGQLQEHELFYLQSRGLGKKFAKYILALGFAEELLNKIEPADLRERMTVPVREKIKAMVLGEGK